jgi:hypothetical protein
LSRLSVSEPHAVLKDTAGGERVVTDVAIQAGSSRGTFRGTFPSRQATGRGWLILPGRAPLAVQVEAVESASTPGVAVHRFMIV